MRTLPDLVARGSAPLDNIMRLRIESQPAATINDAKPGWIMA
jgi:hypothetical protein